MIQLLYCAAGGAGAEVFTFATRLTRLTPLIDRTSPKEALRQAGSMTALGRIATEAEVAGAVLFLASDMSSGITGQLLAVDAGLA